MLRDIYSRFRGACTMLFRKQGNQVVFAGTAVLVHPEGFLLTAANLFAPNDELVISFWDEERTFISTERESVAPYHAKVLRHDEDRGLALLQIQETIEISMPPHVIGKPDSIVTGSSLASLGYAFGYQHIYNQVIQQAVVSARILSGNGTKLFLFDSMLHEGSRGGPLINVKDRRIIGINYGKFKPHEATSEAYQGSPTGDTNMSYAISIEYGVDLMEKEGIEIL